MNHCSGTNVGASSRPPPATRPPTLKARYRASFVATIAAITLASCTAPHAATPSTTTTSDRTDKPNVILIVADDLGYGDLGAYGGAIATPNIDTLARSGIRYVSAYATAPICAPSRAGLLSGRFQGQFGFYFNLVGRSTGMPGDVTTIAEVAKQANYDTVAVGKWHVGEGPGLEPLDQGFDQFFGFLGGATSYFPDQTDGLVVANAGAGRLITRKHFPILDGRTTVDPQGYLTDVFTDKAVEAIAAKHDRPFFLYLAYNAVHTPFEVSPDAVRPFAADPSVYSRVYKAMVTSLDAGVGRVMNAVRAAGIDRHTLIIFISDNGCPSYVHGACSNAPFSGWKAYPLEGGIRVPFIVNWPGRAQSGEVVDRPISTLDIMPTIAAALGQPAPARTDGYDLLAPAPTERTLEWRMGPNHWIREGPWKLIVIDKAADVQSLADVIGKGLDHDVPFTVSPLGQWHMLFNLDRDPGEKNDVSAQHPDIVARLERRFDVWNRQNVDPAFGSRRTYRTLIDDKKVQLMF